MLEEVGDAQLRRRAILGNCTGLGCRIVLRTVLFIWLFTFLFIASLCSIAMRRCFQWCTLLCALQWSKLLYLLDCTQQFTAVPCSAVCSKVQWSTVQCSAVQCSAVLYHAVQCAVQHTASIQTGWLPVITQYCTVQYSMACDNTVQNSAVQCCLW